MFILKSKEQIATAIERAKAHHTSVKARRFGEYAVKGAAGNFYTVRCERRNGDKVIDCECPAGQFGSVCYHSVIALSLHSYMATTPLAQMAG
jgi:hypothetical protein